MNIPYKNLLRIAIIVGIILLIPLLFTIRDGGVKGVGWNWTPFDFVTMGGLLFAAGLAIDFAVRKFTKPAQRIIAVGAVVLAFLALWVELAVDGVSQLIRFLVG